MAALQNGEFEQWGTNRPAGWSLSGQPTASRVPGASGQAVEIATTGSTGVLAQSVEGPDLGATYRASAAVQVVDLEPPGKVQLVVVFIDANLNSLGSPAAVIAGTVSSWQQLQLDVVVPPQAAHLQFRLEVEPETAAPAVVRFDSASLTVIAEPATPTATPTSPATPTPITPIGTPTTQPITPGATPAHTPTATRTASPTATRTASPTATRTPSTAPSRTPTRTATPTRVPTMPPGQRPPPGQPSGFGGLLLNGDFELLDGAAPAYWTKFGGDMLADPEPYRGSHAAALDSATSSTKWLHQVVSVSGGERYEARGIARLRYGNGEVWLRVSWYVSGDGSGSQIAQHDSEATSARVWTELTTGDIQAPGGARSARVRLMLRPEGFASGSFDDVVFEAVDSNLEPRAVLPALAADSAAPLRLSLQAAPVSAAGESHRQEVGLRLSEIMSDPVAEGRDTPYEWIELVNTGTAPVDLAGWRIGDSVELDELPSLVIPPAGYALIAARDAHVPEGIPVVRVTDGDIGRGLNNSRDNVRLQSPGGAPADELIYGDGTNVPAPAAGETIGRAPDSDAWLPTGGPTPGEPNSFVAAPPPITPAASSPAARPSPQGIASDGVPGGQRSPVTFESSGSGESPIPWIVLGAAGGLGGVGVFLGGRRLLPLLRSRPQR